MVRKILSGEKTQTRRTFKQKALEKIDSGVMSGKCFPLDHEKVKDDKHIKSYCPFGQIGSLLWVRETFASDLPTKSGYAYRATHKPEDLKEDWQKTIKWTPSIHMPRSACRLILEITNIRYERLGDITESDAKAEGCDDSQPIGLVELSGNENPLQRFQKLWSSVYGDKSWLNNQWTWVLDFKIHSIDNIN